MNNCRYDDGDDDDGDDDDNDGDDDDDEFPRQWAGKREEEEVPGEDQVQGRLRLHHQHPHSNRHWVQGGGLTNI